MTPYRFVGPDIRSFKLVVFARTCRQAQAYVKAQASSRAHRELRYVGKGNPPSPDGWVAAVARG
jgi:hypothetical protein